MAIPYRSKSYTVYLPVPVPVPAGRYININNQQYFQITARRWRRSSIQRVSQSKSSSVHFDINNSRSHLELLFSICGLGFGATVASTNRRCFSSMTTEILSRIPLVYLQTNSSYKIEGSGIPPNLH